MFMASFKSSKDDADQLMTKASKVAKGKTIAEADIDIELLVAYGTIDERTDRDR